MIQKILVDDIRVGMFIRDTGISWTQAPYLYAREGLLTSQREIDAIRREGYLEAFVDLARSTPEVQAAFKPQAKDIGESRSVPAQSHSVPLEEEIVQARKVYAQTLQFARTFIQKARAGAAPSVSESEAFVGEMVDSALRNETALLNLFKLKNYDEYTYTHCVNVAVLAVVYGKYLELPQDELRLLGVAGLLHDIGKEHVPGTILNKPGRLTPSEFKIVQRHSREGHDMIQSQRGIHPRILRSIVEHHEKFNGNGYPEGLSGSSIDPFSSIISLADIYDALTSRRPYKEPMPLQKALKIIYAMREKDIQGEMVDGFVKCLGVYPVGSLVKLSDSSCALVIEIRPENLLRPKVRKIRVSNGIVHKGDIVDLLDEATQELGIVDCFDARNLSLDPQILFT
ncbi:MAG: HD-GYP domain-containing protein [Desulfovibrionales bacterium]